MPDFRDEIRRRIGALRLAPEREWEIVEELAQHLADRYQEMRAAGATEAESYRAALDELSGEKLLAKHLLDVEELVVREPVVLGSRRRKNMFSDLAQDFRHSLRMLAKSPGFTAVAAIALALGIGANTAVFSVFNAVLLNPLPYPEPGRLVWLWPRDAQTGVPFRGAISPPDFVDYRKQSTVFEHLSAFTPVDLTVTGSGRAERILGAAVSSGFFETLGARPAIGRTILPDDEQTGWPQIVFLSDGLWRRRFGGDPGVLGKTIVLEGKKMTVSGVMPPGFEFPKDAQLWQPLPFGYEEMKVRRFHFLRVIGRMKADITIQKAEAQMKSICASLAKIYPDSNAHYSSQVVSLLDQTVGNLRPTLTVLMAAVGFVLLIACANVAHLLLARASAREREIAIRSSLGASSGRILRQLLTESVLLAVLGGALGVLLAFWGLKALTALHPANLPRLDEVHLDKRVLTFTAALSILTGLLFGLVPALRASRPNLTETLKEGGRGGSSGNTHHRLHNLLVTAEVAVAVVLLAGASLMIRSFQRLENVKPGFESNSVLTVRISLPMRPGVKPDGRDAVFFRALLDGLNAMPGVERAGLVSELPLSGQNNDTFFTIEGRPPVKPSERPNADDRRASAGYFQALGIPILKGRNFNDGDAFSSAKVVIISRALADTFFHGQEPLGQHLSIDHGLPFECEIVGVAGDVLHRGLGAGTYPTMYVPYTQAVGRGANLVIRSRTNPLTLVDAVTKRVEGLNPDIPVFGVHAMEDFVADSIGQPRFRTLLLAVFAGMALLLAAAGIYGVMSYSVTLRTHEIGIRVALGAGRMEVMKAVVGRGMLWALAGVVTGLAAAFGLARLISAMLFDVRPSDPISFTVVPVVLVTVALLASYLPARRATKVDAIVALRYE